MTIAYSQRKAMFYAACASAILLTSCGRSQDATNAADKSGAQLKNKTQTAQISDPKSSLDALPSYIEYPTNSGVIPGGGWDSINNTKKFSTCIEGQVVTAPVETQDLSFQRVVDSASMLKILNASASAKAKFLGGGARGSMSFVQKVETSTNEESVFATALVGNSIAFVAQPGAIKHLATSGAPIVIGSTTVMPISVSPSQLKLGKDFSEMAANEPAKFRKTCGDGFVGSIVNGGVMTILYSLRSSDMKERQDFSAALSGSYGAFSGNASLKTVLEKTLSNKNVKIFYGSSGGGGTPLPTDWKSLEELLTNFPKEIARSPISTLIEVIPYTALPDFPTPSIDNSSHALDSIVDMYFRFHDIEREGYAIKVAVDTSANDNPYIFDGGATLDGLNKAIAEAGRARESLKAAANLCLRGKSCHYPRNVPKDDYAIRASMPILKDSAPAYQNALKSYNRLRSLGTSFEVVARKMESGGFSCILNAPILKRLSKEKSEAEVAFENIMQKFYDDILTDRISSWVIRPAEARCKISFYDSCLTPERISSIKNSFARGRPEAQAAMSAWNPHFPEAMHLGRLYYTGRCQPLANILR